MTDYRLTKSIPTSSKHAILNQNLIFATHTTLYLPDATIIYPHPIVSITVSSPNLTNDKNLKNQDCIDLKKNSEYKITETTDTQTLISKTNHESKNTVEKFHSSNPYLFVLTTKKFYQYTLDGSTTNLCEVSSLTITKPVYCAYSTHSHIFICYSNFIDIFEVPKFYRPTMYKKIKRSFCGSPATFLNFHTLLVPKISTNSENENINGTSSYKKQLVECMLVVFRDNTVELRGVSHDFSYFLSTFISPIISAYITDSFIVVVTNENIIYHKYEAKELKEDESITFNAHFHKKIVIDEIITSTYNNEKDFLFIVSRFKNEEDQKNDDSNEIVKEEYMNITIYKECDLLRTIPIKFKNIYNIQCDNDRLLIYNPDMIRVYNYQTDVYESVIYTPNVLCYDYFNGNVVVGGTDSILFYNTDENIKLGMFQNFKEMEENKIQNDSDTEKDLKNENHKNLENLNIKIKSQKNINRNFLRSGSLNIYDYIPLESKTQISYIHCSKSHLLTISSLGTASFYNSKNGTKIKTFDIPFHITSTASTQEIDLLYIGTGNGNIYVYDVLRGKCVDSLLGSLIIDQEGNDKEKSTGSVIKMVIRSDYLIVLTLDNVIRKINLYSKKKELIETDISTTISDFFYENKLYVLSGKEVSIHNSHFDLIKNLSLKEKNRKFLAEKIGIIKDFLMVIYVREKKNSYEIEKAESKEFFVHRTNKYSDKKELCPYESDKEYNHYLFFYHIEHGVKLQEIVTREVKKMSVVGGSLIVHADNGIFIYEQKAWGFKPIDLDVETTPGAVIEYVESGKLLHALICAIKIDSKDNSLIFDKKIYDKIKTKILNNTSGHDRKSIKNISNEKDCDNLDSDDITNLKTEKKINMESKEFNGYFPLINYVVKNTPDKKIKSLVSALPQKYIPKLRDAIKHSNNLNLKWIESIILFHTGIGDTFSIDSKERKTGNTNSYMLEAIKRRSK